METIKIYLETMFSALPKTEESKRLKNEILISMEEKYNELKAAGKSENEVIGTVISEFGNIEELAEEMGLEKSAEFAQSAENDAVINLTRDEATEYLEQTKKSGFWIGAGVFLIMTGVALMLLISGYSEMPKLKSLSNIRGDIEIGGAVGVFVLLMTIAGAVPLFIVNGLKLARYEPFELNKIRLDEATRAEIEQLDEKFNPRFVGLLAGGVALILFAVGLFIVFGVIVSDEYQHVILSLMLLIIGFAVFMFINAGMLKDAYECLLGKGDYALQQKFLTGKMGKMTKIIGTAAALFWPLVVAAYLLWSFLLDAWHISWIIWPICGLVFGAFAGAIGAYYSLSEDKI
ncbi:MAG: permease prefix domain 1-containing protein [Oscillospiraceae bacterium]|jgi:hypothetical protein|nr:permease prefix domain 1-containing protein [Oscillospiraceae bacterium]